MNHGSLFSGIGGFDLAAQWMGWNNVFHCEWNDFGRQVLKYHFPKSDSLHDIKQTDFTPYRDRIDVLTGGFPCQPFSAAGKRKGTDDDRYLWPEMFRAVREIRPKYVVGENVRGLTNWNGGLVLDKVCSDLESESYRVESFVLPALDKNAPHRRDRIWIVAYRESRRSTKQHAPTKAGQQLQTGRHADRQDDKRNASNTHSASEQSESKCRQGEGKSKRRSQLDIPNNWKTFPTQPPICSGDDGLPRNLDGISFSKWRTESVKAYGNAIVPQVALELFQVIQKIENNELQ